MKDPLVSIGIPVTKPTFLEEAIKHALQQTYVNKEIIILNNAKDESTRFAIDSIVKSYSHPDLYYYVNEKQLPIVENWNKVFSYAKGEFFSLMCDDDKWDDEFLSEMVMLSAQYPNTNIFHSRSALFNDDDAIIRLSPMCNNYESALEFIHERIKYYRAHFLSDFMVRRSSMVKIGGFNSNTTAGWGCDDLTWFAIALDGGIAYSSKILFYYRESEINVSNTSGLNVKLKGLDQYLGSLKRILELIKPENSDQQIQLQLVLKELNVFKSKHEEMFLRSYFIAKYKNKKVGNAVYKFFKKAILKKRYTEILP